MSALVTQPLFGILADRLGHRRIAALGVKSNAVLFSLIGTVPNIYNLFGLILIGWTLSAFSLSAAKGGIVGCMFSNRLGAKRGIVGALINGGDAPIDCQRTGSFSKGCGNFFRGCGLLYIGIGWLQEVVGLVPAMSIRSSPYWDGGTGSHCCQTSEVGRESSGRKSFLPVFTVY